LVRKSEKSFNSEFGVPFTILGVGNPWHNPLAWFAVFKRALALLLLPNQYPNLLVLEVGSGKPGDLAHILRIVSPDVVVVTRLPEIPVHVEAYASPEAVREEEFSPAYALVPHAPLIISSDDPYAVRAAARTTAQVVTYGSDEATVQVRDPALYEEEGKVVGMKASVTHGEEKGTLVVLGSVGIPQVLSGLAALTTGVACGVPLQEAIEALRVHYEPPPGRGRLLEGCNGSVIIDDSYNASPMAVEAALETLRTFPHATRRIAVLGDMLELGRYSVSEHERIATLAHESADLVIGVGIRARAFVLAPEKTRVEATHFDSSREAAEKLPGIIRKGDVVLVKGSQSIRTERIVEALLCDPAHASRLVRQERGWKKKA
jgi:UDP-N-acetylmuramyl pentapeptide synthase